MSAAERLEGAVRAWAVPAYVSRQLRGARSSKVNSGYEDFGPSEHALIFDTETTTDPGQALRVGCFHARRSKRRRVREGLFYNPATVTESELELLRAYVECRDLELFERSGFAQRIFLPIVHRRRGLLIGHNLPFDLFRIAISHEPARGRDKTMRGGFTLAFSENPYAPRVQVKRANPGASFMRLTIPSGRHPEQLNRDRGGGANHHHGYFLDTASLGGALFGGRLSLATLSRLLDTPHKKSASEEHGTELTESYLDYLRLDVQVTWECSQALWARYEALGL
jgi:hypothetical protein